jgi:hypothetical protein
VEGEICTVMESWKGSPNRMPSQGLLNCELLSILAAVILYRTYIQKTSLTKSRNVRLDQYSRVP